MPAGRFIRLLLPMSLILGCAEEPDLCERPVFPARGVVTFRGQPIPDATVRLHPVHPPEDGKPVFIPRGRVAKDGRYQVTTSSTGDGALPGEYLVSVSWQGPLQGIDEEDEDRLRERMPRKFTRPQSSGIRVEITEEDNELPPIEIN